MTKLELEFIEADNPEWKVFVGQQPTANIFHHPAWLQLLKECYGYRSFVIVFRNSEGSIAGGSPFMEMKRFHQDRSWISLPFSDHCSPLTSDAQLLNPFVYSLEAFSKEHNIPKIEVRWNVLGSSEGQMPVNCVLHILSLDSDITAVERRIHHSHLRNIKIARTHNIRIQRGAAPEDLDIFYKLHLETRHRQGVPIQPERYFRLLGDMILNQGLGFISLAYKDSICLAGAVFLHSMKTLTYKYGASKKEGLSLRPNHLIFWDAIQWGCENGFSILDFGRTDVENQGLRDFKSRWGASESPLSYFNAPFTAHARWEKMPIKAIQTIIQYSPPFICKLGGEIYYRYVA